jgi:hypothetical protein
MTRYNTLAEVAMATQTKERFFTYFLFKQHLDKGEGLWDNLIDTKAPLQLEVETDFKVVYCCLPFADSCCRKST